jgi:1-acyl-sn-glycerol-3-phosphate acyltransferase
MKLLLKSLQVIYSIYAMLLFVALMLIVVLFVIGASFFGRIKGGNFIYKVLGIWGDIWLFMIGIRNKNIFITPHKTDHPCIFVINHSSYMDVPVLVKSIRQPMRILAKVELAKIPIFGILYRNATVMVDRSSAEHRAKSVLTLKSILKRGISVAIFPEGTFNISDQPLKEFYQGAFRIALETQTPVKPVIFLDTVDRLHYNSIFSFTPGVSRVIFLPEVPVAHLTMKDADRLKSQVFQMMEMELRKWRSYPDPEEALVKKQGSSLSE